MLLVPMLAALAGQLLVVALLTVPFGPTRKAGLALAGAVKSKYGRVVARTVAVCLVLLLASSLFSLYRQQTRVNKSSAIVGSTASLVDQVDILNDAIESSLIAYALILAILIDRLHHAMKSGDSMKVSLEMLKKQAKGMETEYLRLTKEHSGNSKDGEVDPQLEREKLLKATIADLRASIESLKAEVDLKAKESKASEASVWALKKQCQGIQLECDKLLDDNGRLKAQLSVLDREYTRSEDKKRT